MKEYLLRDITCDCGGDIIVTGVRGATKEGVPFYIVSHGMCKDCARGYELPMEDYMTYVSQNCVVNYVI